MKYKTTKISLCIAAALCIGNAAATDAFNLIGHGPKSLAMGGTGVAHDIGGAGVVVNPATLALLPEGNRFEAGFDIVTADLKITNTATGEVARSHSRGKNNGPFYAPEFAILWRRDRWALGIGAYAADGVGTQYDADSFLSRTSNGLETGLRSYSRLLVMRVPFSAAYQVTDKLSIGASVDAVWTGVNLGMLLDASQLGTLAAQGRMSGTLVPTLLSVPELSAGYLETNNGRIAGGEAESWGMGGRLGLTYQASAKSRVGLAYNFKTHVGDLTGNAGLTAVSAAAGNIPLSGTVSLRDFEMPAHIAAGISHEYTDRVTVAFDYQRVFWSDVMENINVGFAQSGTGGTLDLKLPFNYRDTNVYALGVEYRHDPKWTWRGGFHYAQQATSDAGMIAVIPSTPTTNLTVGFSRALGEGSALDFALAHGFEKSVANDQQPGTSVPIEAKHAQTVAALTYSRTF
jgi:long-chain fatty acid transport protein